MSVIFHLENHLESFCIRSADIDRQTVGEGKIVQVEIQVEKGPFKGENIKEMKKYVMKNAISIFQLEINFSSVESKRERGKFWLRRIHIEFFNLKELDEKILQKYNNPEYGEIFGVYKLWDPHREIFTR